MTRTLLQITGADRAEFLQGLVTNDVQKLDSGPIYAALLTPQGKYLADFFLFQGPDCIFLDIDDSLAAAVSQRLTMYKLRADVHIASTGLHLHRGIGTVPDDGWADPRSVDMGWRAWRDVPASCYVGQEVTARMKHKTELRKGLAKVQISGEADFGADILAAGKVAGQLLTRSGDKAIAYLRFDRAVGPMTCGNATVKRIE